MTGEGSPLNIFLEPTCAREQETQKKLTKKETSLWQTCYGLHSSLYYHTSLDIL